MEINNDDFDEYVVQVEGNEQIHITGKTKRQLNWQLLPANKNSNIKQPILV
jgi:hypothetical protein